MFDVSAKTFSKIPDDQRH